jgi:SAM-dependent methyltransferase
MTMDQEQINHERDLAAFDQNSQTFRSLNQLMWQIPLIAMTLTGGLWFGVSKVNESPLFQTCLLFLALVGNIGLIVVLARLRYIMGEYLTWLQAFHPGGFVAAKGRGFGTDSHTVRWIFQILLGLAALVSGMLMISTAAKIERGEKGGSASLQSLAFYDSRADHLARSYEAVDFKEVHPYLVKLLVSATTKRILDIGSGSGRDAAWMATAGHMVTAVEPCEHMRQLAQTFHPDVNVRWIDDALPVLGKLGTESAAFDIIVLSAVWMHVHPDDRPLAIKRLAQLVSRGGLLYMTLRLGPEERERAAYPTLAGELEGLAGEHRMEVREFGVREDLLARADVSWRTIVIRSIGGVA